MEDSIKRILDSLDKVAPHAWQTAIDYTRTEAEVSLVVGLILFACGVLLLRHAKKHWNNDDITIPSSIFGVIASALGFVLTVTSIMPVLNPEGALIKALLQR